MVPAGVVMTDVVLSVEVVTSDVTVVAAADGNTRRTR